MHDAAVRESHGISVPLANEHVANPTSIGRPAWNDVDLLGHDYLVLSQRPNSILAFRPCPPESFFAER